MKKVLSLMLVGVLVLGSISFADTKSSTTPKLVDNIKSNIEKSMSSIKGSSNLPGMLNKETKSNSIQEYRNQIRKAIELYAPDLLQSFEEQWVEHDTVHASLKEQRDLLREKQKAGLQAELNDLKSKLTSGEISKDVLKTELDRLKVEHMAYLESIKKEAVLIKESIDYDKQVSRTLHTDLKKAIEEDNKEGAYNKLEEILAALKEHISKDKTKLESLMKL